MNKKGEERKKGAEKERRERKRERKTDSSLDRRPIPPMWHRVVPGVGALATRVVHHSSRVST